MVAAIRGLDMLSCRVFVFVWCVCECAFILLCKRFVGSAPYIIDTLCRYIGIMRVESLLLDKFSIHCYVECRVASPRYIVDTLYIESRVASRTLHTFRERLGAGVEYHFQKFNQPYAPL